MDRNRIVHIEPRSWVGISIGAEHTYGDLVGMLNGKREEIELKHPLTPHEAAILNRKDMISAPGDPAWHPGSMSRCFLSDEALVKYAVAHYKDHFPDADILLQGCSLLNNILYFFIA